MSWFKVEVIIVMSAYALLIGLFLLGRRILKTKEKKNVGPFPSGTISVVVPFRNEEANLKKLIESIHALSSGADEYIFVNDHSEDQSLMEIKKLSVPYKILELNTETGKKSAIRMGVLEADSEYIITWDADVIVPKNYFHVLRQQNWSDLVVLPVKMLGSHFVPGFFAMDYQLQAQSNVSLSGFYRPITASGANLLFKKTTFLEMESSRTDETMASGDDQFLFKACREAGKTISVLTNANLRVETEAPKTISSGMQQRFRWLGKSGKVGDSFANVFGLFALVIQLSYYVFAWYQTVIGDWGATIVLILIKGELDAFLTTYKFQEQFNTLKVFFYELLYPFYILALIFGMPFSKIKWKGRSIN